MNLTISGHHLEVTPAIREYLQAKLERIRRHFDHVIDIAVILAVDNLPKKRSASAPRLPCACAARMCTWLASRKTCTQPSTC